MLLCGVWKRVGHEPVCLGVTTADHAKVITSGDEVRYLDRPAPDELMRWWEEQAQKEVRSE